MGAPTPIDCPRAEDRTDPEPRFCVIIPAHDEEAVLERCLLAALEDAPEQPGIQIIVVANGCSDRTSSIARKFATKVKLIETDRASKTHAINLGLEHAGQGPVLVMDADVTCDFRSLRATARALTQDGFMAASPRLEVDVSQSPYSVRAYYRVWYQLPYATERLLGGGVYGLSAGAVDQIGSLPLLIADDLYLRSIFPFERRRTVRDDHNGQPVKVTMFPPRTFRDLVRIEARRWLGTREVRRAGIGAVASDARNGPAALMGGLVRNFSAVDLAIYVTVKLCGRSLAMLQLLRRQGEWNRDMSSRAAQ